MVYTGNAIIKAMSGQSITGGNRQNSELVSGVKHILDKSCL